MVGDGSLLRTDEAAAELNLSKSTVINYAKEGLLRVKRTGGGHRRFPAESVGELKQVLDMDDGPERDAAMEDLRRRNRGETDQPSG